MQGDLDILKLFASVSTPLALAGLIAGGFFLFVRQLIGKPVVSKLTEEHGHELAKRVVIFFFVLSLVAVALGFTGFLITEGSFDFTVHASAPGSGPPASGEILLRMGQHVDTSTIDASGNAVFKRLPHSILGKDVDIQARVPGYADEWQAVKVRTDTIQIFLRPAVVMFSGSIEPPPGKAGSLRVTVENAERDGATDELGRFTIPVRGKNGDRVRVRVFSENRKMVYDDYQSLPGPVRLLIPDVHH